jgi:type IV secretory pathway TrbD component
MTINESTIDRGIRVVAGVVAAIVAFVVGIGSVLGIVLAVVGVVLLATGAVGFCPLYRVLGISTCAVPASKG